MSIIPNPKQASRQSTPDDELRSPAVVMRLARMGCFHQTRLSFLRQLLRRLRREQWRFERALWQVDDKGVGVAVYTATGPVRTYSLIAFAHDLDPTLRSDRVIAQAWDATFVLFDGVPEQADIERLQVQVPLQEAGRVTARELTLSRANRSVRLFDLVRSALAAGRQPDQQEIEAVGYLMRTTAVYGSGKFGATDRRFLAERPEFQAPFQAELLTVYLIRAFTVDIVEHLAALDGGARAVALTPGLRRRLGVGNATGLGMAPFIVNHPSLLNNWIAARELALSRVRAQASASHDQAGLMRQYVRRQQVALGHWQTSHERQQERIAQLVADLQRLAEHLDNTPWPQVERPWNALYLWAEANLGLEGQECVVSLLLEPFANLVDDLADSMSADEDATFVIDGAMTIGRLQQIIGTVYPFALATDFSIREANARFWYVSQAKLEPRLGERYEQPGAQLEHPLASARDISELAQLCAGYAAEEPVATLLLAHPSHRHAVRRAQLAGQLPYAEIHDNLIAQDMVPLDMLRCKLSFFGASNFDPRSDRWIRITLFQHAPFPDELAKLADDDWIYPAIDESESAT